MPSKSHTATLDLIERSALDVAPYKPSNTQLHRVSALWLAANERRLAMWTDKNYRQYIRHIVRIIGPVEINDLAREHVATYVATRRREGIKDSVIIREFETLHTLYEWAARHGIANDTYLWRMRRQHFGLPSRQYPAKRIMSLRELVRIHGQH